MWLSWSLDEGFCIKHHQIIRICTGSKKNVNRLLFSPILGLYLRLPNWDKTNTLYRFYNFGCTISFYCFASLLFPSSNIISCIIFTQLHVIICTIFNLYELYSWIIMLFWHWGGPYGLVRRVPALNWKIVSFILT